MGIQDIYQKILDISKEMDSKLDRMEETFKKAEIEAEVTALKREIELLKAVRVSRPINLERIRFGPSYVSTFNVTTDGVAGLPILPNSSIA